MASKKVFNLANVSRSFATRTRGKEVASLVVEFAEKTKPEDIEVAWNGVNAASPSFIDEFVSAIQSAVRTEDCQRIFFTGDEPRITNLVTTILRRRGSPMSFAVQRDKVESA